MTVRPESSELDPASESTPSERKRPRLIVFDVNETLSDMAPMEQRFIDIGAPGHMAGTWFASLLRDGFALTVAGANPRFAELASESLRSSLKGLVWDVDAAIGHIMSGFATLPVHPDVAEGVQSLHALDITLVTLSNGSTSVAEGLLERNELAPHFEQLLSVEDAPLWKPAEEAYVYALSACQAQAADTMLVAAHPWDIHGASQAGLTTAWVNRNTARYPSQFATPTIEATSLVDLAAQLGAVAA